MGAVFTDTVYTHPAAHTIAQVTGLEGALDGKVDDGQVLTNVPLGAVFTDTVSTFSVERRVVTQFGSHSSPFLFNNNSLVSAFLSFITLFPYSLSPLLYASPLF